MEVTDTMIDHMTNPMTAPMVDIMTKRVVSVRPHKLWHITHYYNQPNDKHHDDQPHDWTHDRPNDQPQDWTLQVFTTFGHSKVALRPFYANKNDFLRKYLQ